MKKIYSLLVIGALGATLIGCGEEKSPKETTVKEKKNIETFQVEYGTIESQLSFPAELIAFRQIDVFAKVTGYVRVLNVNIGSVVQKGQLMVALDAPELNAQLSAAQSRLKSQESRYIAANKLYNRLLETSKVEGSISANDLDQALAEKDSQKAQLDAMKAAYKEVTDMRQYLQIKAPFTGTVTSKNVNIGTLAGPGTSSPLLTLQETDLLKITFSIPELYTGYLKVGDVVSFQVNSLPNEKFTAKVSRLSGALDNHLRSEQIELDYANTNQKLLPGMVGEVLFDVKSRPQTFVVPKSALLNSTEGDFVLRVTNGKVERITVKTGMEKEEKIEVFVEALHPKDILILKASDEYRNGKTVN